MSKSKPAAKKGASAKKAVKAKKTVAAKPASKKSPATKKVSVSKESAVTNSNEVWTAARIRELWKDFFKSKGHLITPSASLMPSGDPTLLFTTAGMVPFKAYFAGTEKPPATRIATIQKCLRTTDLESVGRTERHCTFFEMLGNFSFGDYFKRESIHWAYEFSLKHLKLDPEKIYVTVYQDDDEAEEIWHKEVGVPMSRIRRLGKDANWWGPAGDSGACGPCSELYLDRGEGRCNQDPANCGPGCACDRFMEYWNLVFNQFYQDKSGKLHPLPQTGIDTGAGLERITMLKMEENSVYDTDEMRQILHYIEGLTEELREDKTRVTYDPKRSDAPAFRVLTDHARASTFALADGIFPDNTGRGYVIRRIIRRALLFSRELGIRTAILYRMVPEIVRIYGTAYPEVKERAAEIEKTIRSEEERFLRTLEQGIARFDEYMTLAKKQGQKQFAGIDAFRLYDTYGFPLEMTVELAEKQGMPVDLAGFEAGMKEQKERASKAAAFKDWNFPAGFESPGVSKFLGYNNNQAKSKIQAILQLDGDTTSLASVKAPTTGSVILVLEETPFYPEGGGQVGDTGQIISGNSVFVVHDTKKKQGLILHIGELTEGELKIGQSVESQIDVERREALTHHHSATHLLNKSLRDLLGTHILQTGSLVAPDYLRFDFSHGEKIPADQLRKVEAHVNESIAKGANVEAKVMSIDEAKKAGALATFGEKYGTEVRVLSMGNDGSLSRELCGGCHVSNTGNIQYFHILKESSPGAGNRRIEAVAGQAAVRYFNDEVSRITTNVLEHNQAVSNAKLDAELAKGLIVEQRATEDLKVKLLAKGAKGVEELVASLEADRLALETAQKEFIKRSKKEAAASQALEIKEEDIVEVGQTQILKMLFKDASPEDVKRLGDSLKEKHRNFCGLFGLTSERGPVLVFMANRAAVDSGADCGKLIKLAAGMIGGGGGGRPEMAQAGGKNSEPLPQALDAAFALLKESLEAQGSHSAN
ncbi:MAG: alanine--tRNA ligase [Spirochaetia bacterium]|nr:alanine--tRNA ligase [Spirochaetia bacterium]